MTSDTTDTTPVPCGGQTQSVRAAVAGAGGGVVGSSRPRPVCGWPMTVRKTSACSDRCRAAKSRQRRIPFPVAETKAIRATPSRR
jgi:hypothetical protein